MQCNFKKKRYDLYANKMYTYYFLIARRSMGMKFGKQFYHEQVSQQPCSAQIKFIQK